MLRELEQVSVVCLLGGLLRGWVHGDIAVYPILEVRCERKALEVGMALTLLVEMDVSEARMNLDSRGPAGTLFACRSQ